MTNRINVKDLSPKEDVESIFLVKHIALMESRDKKKYLNMILADKTGDLETRVWSNAESTFDKVKKGEFLKVKGKVNLYQGRKQFVLQKYTHIDSADIDEQEYIKAADVNADKMFDQLLDIVNSLGDFYIRQLLLNILNDSEIQRRLKIWQAGKTIHHAYRSGLLEHILSCSQIGLHLSKHYEVNENYVVAGCILHDICKIYELTDGVNVEYTEEGKLVGHLVKALEIIDRYSYRIENFPYDLKTHLKHIMLSHHGEYEYGSPKIPQTKEAMLVHLVDHMDSKMNAFKTIIQNDNQTGHWSGFVRHLDRIVFKDELPFYPEAQELTTSKQTSSVSSARKNIPKKVHEKEIKTSMGDLLKNIKVD